jgi:capsular exopolysaccharide synthesis family protein
MIPALMLDFRGFSKLMKESNILEQGGPVACEHNQGLTRDGRPLGAMEPYMGVGQNAMSIMALWDILLKRRWTVVTVMVVLSTLVAISTFRTKPVYKAVARVQVEAESPLIQSLNDLAQYQQNWDIDTFIQTQMEILKSDVLAWRMIEEMRLAENPNFASAKDSNKKISEQRKAELIARFKGGLSVQLMPKTHMLLVSYESTDPELAARVSNALVADYIDYNFRQKYDAVRQASGWMEQQLDELKAKVEKSQQALVDYERQNAITNTGDKQSVQEQMLSDLGKDLTTAQSERIQKESLYDQVVTNRVQMATLVHDELLESLEVKQAELRNQYTDIVNQYGPNYPKALRLQQQLADARTQIEQEQSRVIDRIRRDYITAQNREQLAASAVSRQKDELGKLNQLLVEHNMLKRDFDTNQQLYQNLLAKLKEATLSVGLRPNNINLVDSATTPTSPVRPRRLLNTTMGLLAGLFLGIIVAFAQEALDQSVKSIVHLELLLGAPSLAIIPYYRSAYGPTRKAGILGNSGQVGLVSVEKPQSVLAEAYRSLRTAILSVSNPSPKTILVTSTKSGEGKTATSLNLSAVLAQRKGPVVLVDCDLRKPSIAAELRLNDDKGLTGILAGGISLDDALQVHPDCQELSVLTSGPKAENPAELLSSDRMVELLSELARRFEHVIIDSPPVLAVTDAAILAGMVDGVVLVVEGSKTHKGALLHSNRTLVSSGARILGAVFNKYDYRREGAYGYGTCFNYYPYAYYGKE